MVIFFQIGYVIDYIKIVSEDLFTKILISLYIKTKLKIKK